MTVLAAGPLDVHAHVVLGETFGAAGPLGPELVCGPDGIEHFRVGDYALHGVRYRGSLFMDVGLRLDRMDAEGIAVQALSPNPLTYLDHVDAGLADDYCRRHNDALAAVVASHPTRFVGLAQLPAQDPDRACAELQRAVRDLNLLAPYLGTDPGGRTLDDPALDGLWATCVELDVPAFVHPAPSGIDTPRRDPRLARFDLELLVEFAYEETLAVAALVFGGVLARHPALDVCLSHGGGAVPYLLGRWRAATRNRAWSPERLRAPGAFEAELARLWFDVHVGDARARSLLAATVDEDHLVLGTNFGGFDSGAIDAPARQDPRLEANARRLLRLG